ncbi:MAG: ethanolamine ammonia-lyase reactivating factor EutA [Chloroflexi bacterium]|nr:ethanolamine ammonia-lyase reactivating factor EutA [Chloroflexota bacterium]
MHDAESHGHDHVDDPFHGYRTDDRPTVSLNNMIELKSVGIDIGSSTSHLMFSRLVMVRQGLALSSKFKVVTREVNHKSDVLLTPYSNPATIDTPSLAEFISSTYADAKLSPSDIDTGAVIVTGEAAKKENAEAIVRLFSDQAGKFVCASAGPNLEAVMAAYGSGAVARSIDRDKGSRTVLNVDVGGGTSKIAVVKNGSIVETAAINVGARLVAMDSNGLLTRVEDAGRLVGEAMGIDVHYGWTLPSDKRLAMAQMLTDCLFDVLERRPLSSLSQKLMLTPTLSYQGKIDAVCFSGGVAEYIYEREIQDYGDLGQVLGAQIRQRAARPEFGIPLEKPEERIRATVIGAAQYTLQVSGSTIFVSNKGLLPLRNLQVMGLELDDNGLTPDSVALAIQRAFQRFDLVEGEKQVALAVRWSRDPSYRLVRALAEGIVSGLKQTVTTKLPVILLVDADIGSMLGNILHSELVPGCDIVSVDEIELGDFDFVDIGEELGDFKAVPVVVKSLVFGTIKDKDFSVVGPSV